MSRALPTGTVTLLFTDVEGSTRLLHELGSEAYARELTRHHDIVRASLAEHDGVEVDTQGDAFFCSFGTATSAAGCALAIKEGLAPTPIRVRIGLHTGEVLVAGDRYVGLEVHRAARIAACGHGGQIVVSPSTAALLDADSFPIRELGEHRLKDLSAPVRLYQLGDGEFPPLKTLFRTNLPIPATEFVGRESELRELTERARAPGVRLVTLTGPGGTGKTRMALQLAAELGERFPDGLYWVPLAALREGALVASAVAHTLSVDESGDGTLPNAIARSLAEKRLLLLLDNCEHLVEAVAAIVAPLLSSCPNLLVVATSRQPIFVAGEHVFQLQPLASPDAVSLFEARARAAGALLDPAANGRMVEQLCARLDNLPLAVELAAARSAAVPPAALLERLSSRLDLLKGPRDADERQRTLRATIAWSYDLLEPEEQTAFRRLAVFSGGASLDALEAVSDAELDSVLSLVAQSLVRQSSADGVEPRYWMLATIQEFAAVELEAAGEDAAYRDRHLEWFTALARDARDRLVGVESNEWYARLERDLENLRAAFSWALECGDREREAAVALAVVLAPLHLLHGRYTECEDVITKALRLESDVWDEVRLRRFLGRVLRQLGRWEAGIASHLEAQRLLESVETRDETWWDAWLAVRIEQAHHHYYQGNAVALAELVEDLTPQIEEHASPIQELEFLHVLAQSAFRRERYVLSSETEELQREIHRRAVSVGVHSAPFTLGFTLLWRGKFEEAIGCFQDGLAAARRRGDALIEARCLVYQVLANRRLGRVERARELLAELDTLDHLHGYGGLVNANRAWLAYRDGDLDAAAEAAEAAIGDWSGEERAGPTVFQWTARFPLIGVELARDRPQAGLEQARALLEPSQQPLPQELLPLVTEAVENDDVAALSSALEVAARIGYA